MDASLSMRACFQAIARVHQPLSQNAVGVLRQLRRISMMQALQRLDDCGAVADARECPGRCLQPRAIFTRHTRASGPQERRDRADFLDALARFVDGAAECAAVAAVGVERPDGSLQLPSRDFPELT